MHTKKELQHCTKSNTVQGQNNNHSLVLWETVFSPLMDQVPNAAFMPRGSYCNLHFLTRKYRFKVENGIPVVIKLCHNPVWCKRYRGVCIIITGKLPNPILLLCILPLLHQWFLSFTSDCTCLSSGDLSEFPLLRFLSFSPYVFSFFLGRRVPSP